MMKVEQVFAEMDRKFKDFNMKDIYGVFQFNVSGADGGTWHAVCAGDTVRVSRGEHPKPDVQMWADAKNVIKLAQGKLSPAWALVTRRVKVKGNIALINKVRCMLPDAL